VIFTSSMVCEHFGQGQQFSPDSGSMETRAREGNEEAIHGGKGWGYRCLAADPARETAA
jgi:hypothetical protein